MQYEKAWNENKPKISDIIAESLLNKSALSQYVDIPETYLGSKLAELAKQMNKKE